MDRAAESRRRARAPHPPLPGRPPGRPAPHAPPSYSGAGWRRALRRLVTVAVAALLAATGLGFLGAWGWLLDLFSHFRVHWLLALAVLAPAAWALGARRTALAALAGAAANLAVLLPFLLPAAPTADLPPDAPRLRVASVNLLRENRDHARVLRWLEEADADVVVLLEVDPRWWEALRPLRERYPHGVAGVRADHFGVAVLSRLPCDCRVERIGSGAKPSVVARLPLGGETLTLVGAHPLPPKSAAWDVSRDAQIAAIGGFLASDDGPRLLVGDLNATPWSWPLRRLEARTPLRDASRGRGLAGTWPAPLPAPLRIPIDHAYASPELRVLRETVGPPVGSDHRPLLVEVAPASSLSPPSDPTDP